MKDRQAKNPDNETWGALRERWAATVAAATDSVDLAESGVAFARHQLKAARQVQRLAASVDDDEVIQTALAMYLYRDDQPYRFKSDRAFDFQLCRRIRGLSRLNAGNYWDPKVKRSRPVYRDATPRETQALAEVLKEAFGLAGVALGHLARAERAQAEDKQRRYFDALASLV